MCVVGTSDLAKKAITMTKCTYGESARMTWPKALWIEGSGRYASVSFCAPGPTVVLCRSYAAAKALKRQIDDTGCGGQGAGEHPRFEVGRPPRRFGAGLITRELLAPRGGWY